VRLDRRREITFGNIPSDKIEMLVIIYTVINNQTFQTLKAQTEYIKLKIVG